MRLGVDAISLWQLSRKIYRTSLVKNWQTHVDKDTAAWPPADKVDRELSVPCGDHCIYFSFWTSYSPGQNQGPSRLEQCHRSGYSLRTHHVTGIVISLYLPTCSVAGQFPFQAGFCHGFEQAND